MKPEIFLARVREAVRQTESPIPAGGHGVSAPSVAGEWQPLAEIAHDRDALVARFVVEFSAVGGQAERIAEDALNARIAAIARGWNARSCAMAGELDEGLIGRLKDSGSQILPQTPRDLSGARSLAGLEIANDAVHADFGLSDVVCAVAETGTLVLTSAARHSRLATLLPPRYLAIVRAEQIVPNFLAAVELMKRTWGNAWPAAVTLVTGPSRTADIELSLTIGVHGPGHVVVLVVE